MRLFLRLLVWGLLGGSCSACFNSDDYATADPTIVRVLTTTGKAVANGDSSLRVQARVSDAAARNRRQILFKTSLGFFKANQADTLTVDAGEEFTAEAEVASVRTGTAEVTATAGGVEAQEKAVFTFDQAYPTALTVSVDSFAVSNRFNNQVTLTATLSSGRRGKPSVGHPVRFDVLAGSTPVGNFLNGVATASTDATGAAKIRYSPGGISTTGTLTVVATTIPASGTPISATTFFQLYNR
ncbi:hypothetical protein GCM10027346_41420 [Hymenobacter seoulensis]